MNRSLSHSFPWCLVWLNFVCKLSVRRHPGSCDESWRPIFGGHIHTAGYTLLQGWAVDAAALAPTMTCAVKSDLGKAPSQHLNSLKAELSGPGHQSLEASCSLILQCLQRCLEQWGNLFNSELRRSPLTTYRYGSNHRSAIYNSKARLAGGLMGYVPISRGIDQVVDGTYLFRSRSKRKAWMYR